MPAGFEVSTATGASIDEVTALYFAVGAELRLHWVRDVTWCEDKCRARSGSVPENLATFRNTTLTLLRAAGHKVIASTLRTFATNPNDVIKILCRFNK